jgi:A/G-specific adenine glycosylase
MLQQTQVRTVIERYSLFMKRFPTVDSLANAELDEVMALWSGLGYYSRARNLHSCAQKIVEDHFGQFPQTRDELESLPGIGRSTAAAIAAFAFCERTAILDANVKRVISRLFGIQSDQQNQKTLTILWDKAQAILPKSKKQMPIYTQALMDFGATWCAPKHAKCQSNQASCPMTSKCIAYQANQVHLIPVKKKKKDSPRFQTDLLMIVHRNTVLLQKRPTKAIWGGLYSLVELPWRTDTTVRAKFETTNVFEQTDLGRYLSKKEYDMIHSIHKAEPIDHVFSHRRLRMHPWIICVNKQWKIDINDFHWVNLADIANYGIPQPIRVFLESSSRWRSKK